MKDSWRHSRHVWTLCSGQSGFYITAVRGKSTGNITRLLCLILLRDVSKTRMKSKGKDVKKFHLVSRSPYVRLESQIQSQGLSHQRGLHLTLFPAQYGRSLPSPSLSGTVPFRPEWAEMLTPPTPSLRPPHLGWFAFTLGALRGEPKTEINQIARKKNKLTLQS